MSKKRELENYVRKKIERLLKIGNTPFGKAELANLRRGLGKKPGDLPELWGSFLLDMPEAFIGKGDEPSREEWSCYLALTLFAMHQQSRDLEKSPMHVEGVTLGRAMKMLSTSEDDENSDKRVLKRLNALSSSKDIKELAHHLRMIISLLKSNKIPLDYALLAGDIYYLQIEPYAATVRLKWGRDFYRKEKDNNKRGEKNER
jgi:CRISPR system Cascade subunit CasB